MRDPPANNVGITALFCNYSDSHESSRSKPGSTVSSKLIHDLPYLALTHSLPCPFLECGERAPRSLSHYARSSPSAACGNFVPLLAVTFRLFAPVRYFTDSFHPFIRNSAWFPRFRLDLVESSATRRAYCKPASSNRAHLILRQLIGHLAAEHQNCRNLNQQLEEEEEE